MRNRSTTMYDPSHRIITAEPATVTRDEVIGLREVFLFLRGSYRTIAAFMLGFSGLAITYCLLTTPIFTSSAQVLIEPIRAQSFLQEGHGAEQITDTGRVESQMEVIKSDQIGDLVIRKLDLVNDPEYQPGAPPFYAPILDLLKEDVPPPSEADREATRLAYAQKVLDDRLLVRRVGQSYVLELSVRSIDATKSALITNTILASYLDADIDAKAGEARRGSAWLNERLTQLRDQATDTRRQLELFKASGEASSATEARVKVAELESATISHSKLYDAFLLRFIEMAQKITYPVADARIISSALRPLSRSHPKTLLIVAFAGILGIATGIGAAIIRRSLDDRIFGSAAIRRHGIEMLGRINAVKLRTRSFRGAPIDADRLLSTAFSAPGSGFAGDMRAIKASINSHLLARKASCIGITSANEGDGKSTVAANLAHLFALAGSRTLLIDASSADPVISRAFAPSAEFGLVQALAYPDALARLITVQPDVPNLFVLPLGTVNERVSPAEQIASDRQRLHLDDLRQDYHLIIIDLPALSTSPDARALGPLLDGLILVAAFGRTTAADLEGAVQALRGNRAEVIGAILNKVDRKNPAWAG